MAIYGPCLKLEISTNTLSCCDQNGFTLTLQNSFLLGQKCSVREYKNRTLQVLVFILRVNACIQVKG